MLAVGLGLSCVLAVGWSAPAVGEATLEVQQERSSESLVDFNGDGFADLALRSDDSYDTEGHGVGAVQVIYGSRSGLTAQGSQYWAQDDFPGVTRSISMSEFGHAIAAGDFNGDNFSDLAVGLRRRRRHDH